MRGGGEPCLYFHGLSQQNQEPSWLIFLLLIFPHTIFISQICFHYFRNIFQIHCAFISQVILPSVTLHTSRALQQNVPLSDSLLLITALRFCLLQLILHTDVKIVFLKQQSYSFLLKWLPVFSELLASIQDVTLEIMLSPINSDPRLVLKTLSFPMQKDEEQAYPF